MSSGTRPLGVVLNGVTGRMGYRQHLVRSLLAIREEGGVVLTDGTRVMPDPMLVGRNQTKLDEIAERHHLSRWTTDLEEALADADNQIYFDAQATPLRAKSIQRAIEAGKHVYTEKPLAETLGEAVELARLASRAGAKNGVVQDKLFLPGIAKLRRLISGGFFGRILSLRGEFGYWIFEGDWQSPQRPSWNYRREEGGGIVLDMFCHWSYLLENLLGRVQSVTAKAVTQIPARWDENGDRYEATADDTAYAIFEIDGGVTAQINSSWCVRVFRDDLLQLQVDGTEGSAVAGLRDCVIQHRAGTPRPVWNPDEAVTEPYRRQWQPVPDNDVLPNAFKYQWEEFIRHVCEEKPFPYDFLSAARGVQLAEAALRSSNESRTVALREIEL